LLASWLTERQAQGAPALRDPELRLPPLHLVSLVYLVCLVFWFDEMNHINQINE